MTSDFIGDMLFLFREERHRHDGTGGERAGIAAVVRAVRTALLNEFPPGSLWCRCGDIVSTDYQCETCRIFDRMSEPEHLQTGRERVAEWVWCSEVWAVMTNDGCAMENRHEPDCPCENRYPLTLGLWHEPNGAQ